MAEGTGWTDVGPVCVLIGKELGGELFPPEGTDRQGYFPVWCLGLSPWELSFGNNPCGGLPVISPSYAPCGPVYAGSGHVTEGARGTWFLMPSFFRPSVYY